MIPGTHLLNARLLRYRSRPEGEDARALAQDLLQAQRFGDARGVAVSALGEDGEDAGLLVLEGRAWLMERDLLRAQAALVRAVRADREFAEAYRWLGEVLLARGDAPRALRALEKAVSLNPDDAEALALREHARALDAEHEASAAEAAVAPALEAAVAPALEEERITPVPVEVLEAIDEIIEAPPVAQAAPSVAEPEALPPPPEPWEPWDAVDAEEAGAPLDVPGAADDAMEMWAPEPESAESAPDVVSQAWEAAEDVPEPPAPAAVWEPPLVAPRALPMELRVVVTMPAFVAPPVVPVETPVVAVMPVIVAPPIVPVELPAFVGMPALVAPPVVALPIPVAAGPRVPPRPPPVPKVEDFDVEPVTLPPLPPQPYDDSEPELHAPSLPPDALDDEDDEELESDPAGPDSSEPPEFAASPESSAEATGSPFVPDAIESEPEAPLAAPISYAPSAWSRSVSPSAVRRVGVGATALLLCAGAFLGWTLRERENAERAAQARQERVLAALAEADARAKAAEARRAAAAERAAREQAALAQAAEAARKAAAEAAERDVPARLGHVDELLGLGRVADAQAELAAIPEAKRDAAPVREAGARVALASELPADALALLEPLAGARKASASTLALYGHALYRLDRVNVAAAAFDRALARDAVLPEALIGRAEVHLRAERPGDALALLDRAEQALAQRSLAPDWRARMYTLVGRAYVERHGVGDRDLAVVALKKALALGAAPAEAYFWLGEALGGRNTRPAADGFKKYLQREPTGRYVPRAKRALGPML